MFVRILGATNGIAQLSPDGRSVLFSPSAGFVGAGSFTFVADDGFSTSPAATVVVDVSNAPLVRLDFAQRGVQLAVGETFTPTILGDFADQLGVTLPFSYVSLTSTDPAVANVSNGRSVSGMAEGFAAAVVGRGTIQAATALVIGNPSRFDNPQLVYGLNVYPAAITLVPNTGSKQFQVQIGDFEDVTAALTGTRYFVGNSDVLSVQPDGLLTARAEGSAAVTIIHSGAEIRVPVRVRAPQVEQAREA